MRSQPGSLPVRLAGMVIVAFVALSGGCERKPAGAASVREPVLGAEHRFVIDVGGQMTNLRLAVHDSERARGLMEVKTLAESEGMLFVWPRPQSMSFYMRNVSVPLDIGFFDSAGVLREIYPMYPGIEDSVVSHGSNLQFAIEMNQGWFQRHSVRPGATFDLAALRDALGKRGYDPVKFLPEK